MKLKMFVKGFFKFTCALIESWLVNLPKFWTKNNLYWFNSQAFFEGEDSKKARDCFVKEFDNFERAFKKRLL